MFIQFTECDPVRLWELLPKSDPLACLAIHVLSFTPNSASCERIFSTMGNIKTKRRNRLTPQKTRDFHSSNLMFVANKQLTGPCANDSIVSSEARPQEKEKIHREADLKKKSLRKLLARKTMKMVAIRRLMNRMSPAYPKSRTAASPIQAASHFKILPDSWQQIL